MPYAIGGQVIHMKWFNDSLSGHNSLGFDYCVENGERWYGLLLWNKVIGIRIKETRRMLSAKKFQNSVDDLSTVIAWLNEKNTANRQSEEPLEQSEHDSNPS
jgi:hypothetical protein